MKHIIAAAFDLQQSGNKQIVLLKTGSINLSEIWVPTFKLACFPVAL